MQIFAPIAAFRVVAYATTDPLDWPRSVHDAAPEPTRPILRPAPASPWRLLCLLRGQPCRRVAVDPPPPTFEACNANQQISWARGPRRYRSFPYRLERPSARASASDVNCAAPWAVLMRPTSIRAEISMSIRISCAGPDRARHRFSAQRVTKAALGIVAQLSRSDVPSNLLYHRFLPRSSRQRSISRLPTVSMRFTARRRTIPASQIEMSLSTVNSSKTGQPPACRRGSFGDISKLYKRISSRRNLDADRPDGSVAAGFQNLETTFQYQF